MSMIVARMQKMKSGNLVGIGNHNQRKTQNHTNKEIDPSLSKLNYDLVGLTENYKRDIEKFINENKSSPRAVRKDAVLINEWIISSDRDFFKDLSQEEIKNFFSSAKDYFAENFGEENIRYAIVHLDETTPHMHVGFVPIIENSLSAKKLIDRKFLMEVQDQLPAYLKNLGFDIQRGIKGSKRKHKDTKELKKELDREVENKYKDINAIESYKNELEGKIEQLETHLNQKTIEYDNITKTLHKNSLVMCQIQEMKVEPIMFSSDKVKIDKNDFERLKDSALKAYTQHNLYATVLHQLEELKGEKQYYKSELEESRRYRADDYNNFRYELKSLKKENERLGSEINKVNEILRSMSKESQVEFLKVKKEIELKKEIEKENINFSREKNKSHEMSL